MKRTKAQHNKFRVFTRNWWKLNNEWPNGLEPDATGRKTTIADRIETEEAARSVAQEWNRTHNHGKLSRKAEYELY